MKLLIFFLIIIITASASLRKCRGISFNNKYYEPEIIKEGISRIEKLVLNRNDNTLYFIFDNLALVPNKALGYINLDSKAIGLVNGLRNTSSVAIDQINNIVYAGGPDGLYIVNSRKILERQPVFHNINDMFFKDILYFTSRGRETFKVINNVVFRVPELQGVAADKIILDDDNNIFYTADRRLYRIKLRSRDVNPHRSLSIDALTVDAYFKPYVATTEGVYAYNKFKYALDKVSNIKGLSALTFNKMDDPIYGVVDVIVKLASVDNAGCYDYQ